MVSFSFSPATPTRLIELASQRFKAPRQSVFYGDLLACNRFDVTERLGMVQQDTLVICGADDQMTPVRFAQYLSSSIPNARLSIIPNAGHMVIMEQPRVVADSLLSFLKDISFHPGEEM